MLTPNTSKIKVMDFYGNDITTIIGPNKQDKWVTLNDICVTLGLDISVVSQMKKFGPKWKYFVADTKGPEGDLSLSEIMETKTRLHFCVKHHTIQSWVFKLKEEDVKDPKLLRRYQKEFATSVENCWEGS